MNYPQCIGLLAGIQAFLRLAGYERWFRYGGHGGKAKRRREPVLADYRGDYCPFFEFYNPKKKTNMFSLLNWVYVRSMKWFSRKLGEIIDVEDCQWGCRFDVQGTREISIPIDLFHPSCVIFALLSTLDFVEVWVACLFYLSGWVEVRAAWLWSRTVWRCGRLDCEPGIRLDWVLHDWWGHVSVTNTIYNLNQRNW